MRRASSAPDTTCTSTPASSAARRSSSPRLPASRTALVATAWTSAPARSASWRMRRSESTARSIASGASTFMSPEPEPSRTTSFSRSITSKRPLPAGRAITMWNELVPRSIAATGMSEGAATVMSVRDRQVGGGERAGRELLAHHAARDAAQGVVHRRRHAVAATEQHDLAVEEVDLGRAEPPGDALPRRAALARVAVDRLHVQERAASLTVLLVGGGVDARGREARKCFVLG